MTAMRRLDFRLPDFCRVSWASEASRLRWEPVIHKASALVRRLEVESVLAGMRRSALVSFFASDASERESEMAQRKLTSRILYSFAAVSPYVSDLNRSNAGTQMVTSVVGRTTDVAKASEAFSRNDTETLGAMLGYPACCIRFFDEVWNRERHIDTTWPMAARSAAYRVDSPHETATRVKPQNNLLLRWLGVRPVFHLPCCFECGPTFATAESLRQLAHDIGEGKTVDALYELLDWPVEWSALHGIAEVSTPVLRISARTDATAQRHVVRNLGGGRTIEAAAFGNRFPYVPRPTRSRAKSGSLSSLPSRATVDVEAKSHEGSGFATRDTMVRAFAPIIAKTLDLAPSSVAHFACKNGALLHQMAILGGNLILHGIDQDETRISGARLLLPHHAANLLVGDFFDKKMLDRLPRVDVGILMLGRLLELPAFLVEPVVAALARRCSHLVVYAFDDWLRRQSLDEMARKLKIVLEDFDPMSPSVARITFR